jgi:hypothetical protein
MTNRKLLSTVQRAVGVLMNGTPPDSPIEFPGGAQTTTVRYAVKENRDRLQSCKETLQEMLAEDAEEVGEDPTAMLDAAVEMSLPQNGGAPDTDLSDEAIERIEEHLDTETPFEPYTVPASAVMEEPSVPIPVLDLIDWIIED